MKTVCYHWYWGNSCFWLYALREKGYVAIKNPPSSPIVKPRGALNAVGPPGALRTAKVQKGFLAPKKTPHESAWGKSWQVGQGGKNPETRR